MRPLFLPIALVLLLAAGCTTTSPQPAPEATADAVAAPDSAWSPQSAYVFVDGEFVGVTPTTVRIRRSFGMRSLSLRTGPKRTLVRKYEIEITPTSNQSEMMFSFSHGEVAGERQINADDLPTRKKGSILVIPYFSYPIEVEDRTFNLTILVGD